MASEPASIEEPPAETVAITGIAVDETGAPVGGAEISTDSARAHTRANGSFHMEAPRQRVQKYASLRVTCLGYDFLKTDVAWGTADARLLLHRNVAARIQVVAADTGAPIERYAVRCGPSPEEEGPKSHLDFMLRVEGPHPDGIAEIPGLRQGRNTLVVQPDDSAYDDSQVTEIEGRTVGDAPVRIALARMVTAVVHVQTHDGVPISGTRVEVLRQWTDTPIDLETFAWDLAGRSITTRPNRAIKISEGTTNETGTVELRGPSGVALAVRGLGPGHGPCVQNERFTEGGEITLVVAAGATLFGKIGPEGILSKLASDGSAPGLSLTRREGMPKSFPAELLKTFPLEPDGTFRWTGIPPGTWSVSVRFSRATGMPMGLTNAASELVGTVDLREGEAQELHADLALALPGKVVGRVQLDGAPAAKAYGQLIGQKLDVLGHEQKLLSGLITFDDAGAFSVDAMPGTYRLRVSFRRGETRAYAFAGETVVVSADQTVEQDFTVASAAVRVRLLRGDGKPVEGVVVKTGTEEEWIDDSPPTDAQGWTTFAAVPIGSFPLSVVRADLVKPSALDAYMKANINDPVAFNRMQIRIGEMTTRAGETTEMEITLPGEAGY